jgi:hypothetical protein
MDTKKDEPCFDCCCGEEETEPDYTDPCIICGVDQSQVGFESILHCDACSGTLCQDCAIITPVRFDVVDTIKCKNCKDKPNG